MTKSDRKNTSRAKAALTADASCQRGISDGAIYNLINNAIKRTKKADPVHVVVKVDGRRWRRVLSLSGSRSDDRHYVLETRPNGSATVQFGDGAHGASASKASRVEITYRTGGGGAGNVRLCLRRTARPTRDLALWVAIRNRTHAVNFGG
jgi:hypothetical protein